MPDPKKLIDEICGVDMESVYQLSDGTFGVHPSRLGFIIPLVESLFRPMRAVELELESRFPGFLFGLSRFWPPSETALGVLKDQLFKLWKEIVKEKGDRWVLAVGAVPIPITHRPRLIAPWVTGVTVKRWLITESVCEDEATTLAIGLTTVLLGQQIRQQELEHWENLLQKVLVSTKKRKAPLPAYLANLIPDSGQCDAQELTPSEFIKLFPIDADACQQFVRILSQSWAIPNERLQKRPSRDIPKRVRSLKEPIAVPDNNEPSEDDTSRSCGKCGAKVHLNEIYHHLEMVHSIPKEMVEALPNRKELRRMGTRETLYRWEGN